jgi:tyrosyl-tRNA synthetase
MKKELSADKKIDLITRNLEEVISLDELKKLLEEKKEITLYWGTTPTGSPHVSYFYPFLKIADFLNAGLKVKILIADLHAALDGISWEILDKRQKYYGAVIPAMINAVGADFKNRDFVDVADTYVARNKVNIIETLPLGIDVVDSGNGTSAVIIKDVIKRTSHNFTFNFFICFINFFNNLL